MTYELDDDTALEDRGAGCYRATVTDRWNVGAAPNGGYLMTLALRAVSAEVATHPDPLTTTAHFLRPARPGPAEVEVEVIRSGRTLTTAEARLQQPGGEVLRLLTTFGDLEAAAGPSVVHASAAPPALPEPDDCLAAGGVSLPGGHHAPIIDRVDLRFPPGSPGWAYGRPSQRAEQAGWFRLADGREPDVLALPVVVDGFPPVAFELGVAGWVPTVELTVHARGRPAPGWLRCRIVSRFVIDGYMDEEAEVWDSAGNLVAQARQLARLGP